MTQSIRHVNNQQIWISFSFLPLLFLTICTTAAFGDEYYNVKSIDKPEGQRGETGGITFTPEGNLVILQHKGGRVFKRNSSGEWRLFAEGLHEPQGIFAPEEDVLYVMQRPELTKLVDTTGDGFADRHETVSNDFGMSGNYHEFAFGPAVGPDGNFFVALNTASNGAGIWDKDELRGEFKQEGRPGRMYSAVPYRGWVLKITPSGETIPWALGFRSPAGIDFDSEGRLFVNDNQGDWLGTNRLYHVKRGHFYGHVSSLVWKPGFEGNPLKLPVKKLDSMRTKPTIKYPYGSMSNSPSQILEVRKSGNFGPYEGQLLVGELNHPRIMRIMLDNVAGHLQGAVATFIDGDIGIGNHRLTFGPDNNLWVGKTARKSGWTGSRGLKRVSWTGKTPFDVQSMKLKPNGFELTFTKPVDAEAASSPEHYKFSRYYYEYHRKYGSKKYDQKSVGVTDLRISSDQQTVQVQLEELKPGYIYDLRMGDISSRNGEELYNDRLAYTLNYLPDGTTATPQFKPAEPISFGTLKDNQLQAENYSYKQNVKAIDDNNRNFTGNGYVDPQGTRGRISWTLTDVPENIGSLRIRYALGDNKRPMNLEVNSKTKTIPFTGTGDWNNWETIDVDVQLKKGKNKISLVPGDRSGPNIDAIEFLPVD